MKPSEILEKAVDLIEPEGKWIQGNFASGGGCYCAAGAIFYAAPREANRKEADKARDIFRDFIKRRNISNWNDAPERTQAEVVAALRSAAALAKEQEAV